MKIRFLGAAREVTGSCFLVETDRVRFLVECGLFQGGREATLRNYAPWPFDPKTIDFVLLTHAHIDHSGLLPKLVKDGFRGPVHVTSATADLLEVMLPDSGYIQEKDAERARRYKKPSAAATQFMTPLYTQQDAQTSLTRLQRHDYDRLISLEPGVRCRFHDAGHILGSAIIEIWLSQDGVTRKLVFSGDLGQPGRPIVRDPVAIDDADFVIIESTYGNRLHKDLAATEDELIGIVENTLAGGNVIIPAFAVGRTQEIIYHLHRLTRAGRLHGLKIFVDSPMATRVTQITREHMALFDNNARELAGWHALGDDLPYLHFTASVQESMALNRIRAGAIIISASGMSTAGRIRHHLRHNLPRRECSILITGFQAQGTLGRQLVDGARQVRLFGQQVAVNAAIHAVGGLSAHADQAALLGWASNFHTPPTQAFVVHGEKSAALALAGRLQSNHGWTASVPEPGQSFHLINNHSEGKS